MDRRYGIEAGKITAGLAPLMALSGIKEAYDEGRKWLKEYLLFEMPFKLWIGITPLTV